METVKPKKFTCCTFIVNPPESKVLLLFHKKLSMWLPPGGHIEENEAPHEAALRENLEEIGMKVELFPQAEEIVFDERVNIPPQPHRINLVKQPDKIFVDFVFFAKANATAWKDNEGHQIKWFSKEEISKLTQAKIYPNIRELALEALEKIK